MRASVSVSLLQVLVARVGVGLHGECGVIVPAHLLTMEIGTPTFPIRNSAVGRESCNEWRGDSGCGPVYGSTSSVGLISISLTAT